MKNIFFLLLLLLIGNSIFAQQGSWNPVPGKTRFTDSIAFIKPKNNIAEDSVLTLAYSTGILKMKRVTNSFIIPVGVDSITLYNGVLCQWQGGTPTCYFLDPSVGDSDSLALNFDSTWILHYRNGQLRPDSIFLIHTVLYTDNHFQLTPNYLGDPYTQLLEATRLVDSVYESPFATGFLYVQYATGQIDSVQGGGGSGGTNLANIYWKDSVLSGNRIVHQNNNTLAFRGGNVGIGAAPTDLFQVTDSLSNNILFEVSPSLFHTYMYSTDNTSTGIIASVSDILGNNVRTYMTSSDGTNAPEITANGIDNTITLQTGSANGTGSILIFDSSLATASNGDTWTLLDNLTGRGYWGAGGGSGTTIYETETASGSPDFTFTTVPASGDDFIIFVNGAKIRQTTDYTWVGNVVSIPTIVVNDIVEYQRIK